MRDIHKLIGSAACVLTVASSATGARVGDVELRRFEYTAVIMAVDAEIQLFCEDERSAKSAAKAALDRMTALDAVLSDYNRNSELMRLCSADAGAPANVSGDLFRVLERSQQIARASDGAFDITAGPLTHLWRAARRDGVLPREAALEAARSRVGWQLLELHAENRTVTLRNDHMQLDLGGIGKGFAVDEAMRILRDRGVDRCLVRLAGDIAVGLPPPGEEGWSIIINMGLDTGPRSTVTLREQAISTSGDAEQFVEVGGTRYSHIIDPRTGMALTDRRAVTVLAPDATTSDALSTAICVLGADDGSMLAKGFPGVEWLVQESDDGQVTEVRSPGFHMAEPSMAP